MPSGALGDAHESRGDGHNENDHAGELVHGKIQLTNAHRQPRKQKRHEPAHVLKVKFFAQVSVFRESKQLCCH